VNNFHPEAVRLFLLSNHYRSPVDFSDETMQDAVVGLDKLYAALERVENENPPAGEGQSGEYWERFCTAMDDDFNTARGIAELFDAARHLNRLMDARNDTPRAFDEACAIRNQMRAMGRILGLLNFDAAAYNESRRSAVAGMDPAEIDRLVEQRAEARRRKDFAEADRLRDQLAAENIILKDHPDGSTTWKVGS